MTVSSTMRYPPATVNNRRNAKSRSVCPDQGPWSMRVKRSWETLSNASAMAEHVVRLVKYSNAMRYIHSGSGIDAHLPSESLCLFLCGLPVTRISCYKVARPHMSLRQPLPPPECTRHGAIRLRWQERTPAMAAGLTDHVWTFRELLTAKCEP